MVDTKATTTTLGLYLLISRSFSFNFFSFFLSLSLSLSLYLCCLFPGPTTTQQQFFNGCGIKGLLDSALSGYAATAFAYGQTGSGKTFTISGVQERIETIANDTGGSTL